MKYTEETMPENKWVHGRNMEAGTDQLWYMKIPGHQYYLRMWEESTGWVVDVGTKSPEQVLEHVEATTVAEAQAVALALWRMS